MYISYWDNCKAAVKRVFDLHGGGSAYQPAYSKGNMTFTIDCLRPNASEDEARKAAENYLERAKCV